jgi:hypothetical protein
MLSTSYDDPAPKSIEYRRREIRRTVLNRVSKERIQYLWRRVRSAAKTIGKLNKINRDIQLYGARKIAYTTRESRQFFQSTTRVGLDSFVLLPKHPFRRFWSSIISILLLYTATVTPYQVCFIEEEDENWFSIVLIIDCIFFMDIIINFFSAYTDQEGKLITNRPKIMMNYLKTWFFIDLISCIPFQVIFQDDGGDAKYNKLIRLVRVPRLYRLIRVLRLLKMARLFNKNTTKKIIKLLQINWNLLRLLQFSFSTLILAHILSCLWYYTTRIDESNPDNWVVRSKMIDKPTSEIYIASFYWIITTLTTVGFGDIVAYTLFERIFCVLLMVFGVGFYSYIISNLSSIISSIDSRTANLKYKLESLDEFAKLTKIPQELMHKIQTHIM